jgi:hypothetical protein
MDLAAQGSSATDHGNLLGLVSSYTSTDGSQHAMADVWFAKEAAVGTEVHLDDVLTAPASDVISSASSATASSSTPAEASAASGGATGGSNGITTDTASSSALDLAAQMAALDDSRKHILI